MFVIRLEYDLCCVRGSRASTTRGMAVEGGV